MTRPAPMTVAVLPGYRFANCKISFSKKRRAPAIASAPLTSGGGEEAVSFGRGASSYPLAFT